MKHSKCVMSFLCQSQCQCHIFTVSIGRQKSMKPEIRAGWILGFEFIDRDHEIFPQENGRRWMRSGRLVWQWHAACCRSNSIDVVAAVVVAVATGAATGARCAALAARGTASARRPRRRRDAPPPSALRRPSSPPCPSTPSTVRSPRRSSSSNRWGGVAR